MHHSKGQKRYIPRLSRPRSTGVHLSLQVLVPSFPVYSDLFLMPPTPLHLVFCEPRAFSGVRRSSLEPCSSSFLERYPPLVSYLRRCPSVLATLSSWFPICSYSERPLTPLRACRSRPRAVTVLIP